MRNPITAQDVATVVHRMAQGDNLEDACSSIGRAPSAVRPLLKELGYPTRIIPPKPVITKADVEAELAKLRGSTAPLVAAVPARTDPASTCASTQPENERKPSWPALGRFDQALARASANGRDRLALADRLAAITHCSPAEATRVINRLTPASKLSTEAAASLCQALGVEPQAIWPDWTEVA